VIQTWRSNETTLTGVSLSVLDIIAITPVPRLRQDTGHANTLGGQTKKLMIRRLYMKKLIVILLCLLLSGCLIEEKKYYGCDADSRTDPPSDTIEMPETSTKTDTEFLDMFEEVTATK